MGTIVNEQNQVINEEGLPFVDPVEPLPPTESGAADVATSSSRAHGLVLPFQRSAQDLKRSKADRKAWMNSIFDKLEAEEQVELAKEDQEVADVNVVAEALQGPVTAAEDEDSDDEAVPAAISTRQRGAATPSTSAASTSATASTSAPSSSFSGLRKGFLNSAPRSSPPITTPTARPSGKSPSSTAFKTAQVKERSPLRFQNLTISDDDSAAQVANQAQTSTSSNRAGNLNSEHLEEPAEEEGEEDHDEPELDEFDQNRPSTYEDDDDDDDDEEDDDDLDAEWDDEEGYNSDDLRDLAPDMEAEIDNAELAQMYAKAREGLLQSRALDEMRKSGSARSDAQGGEEFVPLNASIPDPSARSTSAGPRVSHFRASRLSRAVDDFGSLLQRKRTDGTQPTPSSVLHVERNPLLLVPDLAPIRYPKNGDASIIEPGVVVDNIELDGESDEDEQRLHEVMKARLDVLEQSGDSVAVFAKPVVERSEPKATVDVGEVGERRRPTVPIAAPAAGSSSSSSRQQNKAATAVSTPNSRPDRVPVPVRPKEEIVPDPYPVEPPPKQANDTSTPAKQVRFDATADEKPSGNSATAQGAAEAEPLKPKLSRFKARQLAQRGES
ncbi:hypothetical protein OC846_000923 [Tilletia horrida]|uniref:DUF3835 domain-containing protein n=1 Tax=Tilletia horrida TaxID=155126 RepID=A0AAN6GUV3_9BASI|nr:hypothetical protein OC846_000923 [Tilletia horrida]